MKNKIKVIIPIIIAIPVLLVIFIDQYIGNYSRNYIYSDISKVPLHNTALLLGTAKYYRKRKNVFYNPRIAAAKELFNDDKVKAIIISGDNSRKDYDEPSQMKEDLMKLGIPDEYITLDYAGFRTLDSIARAKNVFNQNSIVVISQKSHCERAVYLGRKWGLDIVGYIASDAGNIWDLKLRFREVFARVKAWLDVNILSTQPKYYGEPIAVKSKNYNVSGTPVPGENNY